MNAKDATYSKTNTKSEAQYEHWFIFRDYKNFGPFTEESIIVFLAQGLLNQKHHIWKSGWEEWKKIESIELFSAKVQPTNFEMSDEDFAKQAHLQKQDLVSFYNNYLEQKKLENSVSKFNLNKVSDLYGLIKQKLYFGPKKDETEIEK